jgi:glycosyltransferase involved in cell wall biosynthesis
MLVTVVMAAFEGEALIGEAIRSVIDQTHTEWELVVVDDGSTDGTLDIVRGFADPRIRILAREHVGVLGQVRNPGMAAARGDAVALLDQDDVWLPRKLERQVDLLARRPEVGVVHTGADLLVDGVRQTAPLPAAGRSSFVRRLLEQNFVYSSSAIVRRSLLDTHGLFDPDPTLAGSVDLDLWLRLAPHTEFARIDDVLLLYRVHAGQSSGAGTGIYRSAIVALEKLGRRDPGLVATEPAAVSFALGRQRQLAGEQGGGRRDLLRALRRRPLYPLAWRWLARSFTSSR